MFNSIMIIILLIMLIVILFYFIKLYQLDKDGLDAYYGYGILGLIIKSLRIDVEIRGILAILLLLYMSYKMKKHIDLLENTKGKKV